MQEEAEEDDGETPFSLQTRQPWADKSRPSAKPTEEQTAWLLAEGVIKEDEPDKEVRPHLEVLDLGFWVQTERLRARLMGTELSCCACLAEGGHQRENKPGKEVSPPIRFPYVGERPGRLRASLMGIPT